MTYKEALAMVRERATAKYGDALAGRLKYLVQAFYEKGSRDITQKTADRKVQTLTTKFFCSEKQLRRILEKLEEIEVQDWRNRTIRFKFTPQPLIDFDIDRFERQSKARERKRLEDQAERMRERRSAARQQEQEREIRNVQSEFLRNVFHPGSCAHGFVKSVLEYAQSQE